ncbi:MAG: NAD(P)-binding domain-containing protein, partial [Actinobacteria bacterium]|nr:NAD(P)-binding domain-containing protein [Actinomycetota bacterium]
MNASERAGRLGIGVIGAGRVGPVLALALAGAGHAITGVSAISAESRERAETLLPGVPILDVPEVVRRSELVLFAVPGDQLPGLIAGLTETGAWQPGQLVVHTAAEYGHGVFAPALAAGVIPIALHPALVFTGTSLDLGRLVGSTVAVTAPGPVLPIGQALAVEMGAEPIV